jgi:pimeloyl-ACP methyl ester carboxylesterase
MYATADFALARRPAELTGRYVKGAYQYAVIEDASHWLPEEHADVVTPILLEHLARYPI